MINHSIVSSHCLNTMNVIVKDYILTCLVSMMSNCLDTKILIDNGLGTKTQSQSVGIVMRTYLAQCKTSSNIKSVDNFATFTILKVLCLNIL